MQNQANTQSSLGWKNLRRLLIGVAVIATIIGLFYAEEDVRGHFTWAAAQREMVAKGFNLDPHTLEPAPVPDDQNFAMTPFLAPLFDFNPAPLKPEQSAWRDTNGYEKASMFASNFYNAYDSVRSKMEDPKHTRNDLITLATAFHKQKKTPAPDYANRAQAAEDILRYFEPYSPVLEELRTASARPYSRFNIGYHDADPTGILLPHLAVLKKTAQIASYRASAELAVGKNDVAFDDVLLALAMEEKLRGEPFMISHLVRLAIVSIVQRPVWEGLAAHAWSDAQLQQLQDRCSKQTILADTPLSMRWELVVHSTVMLEYLRHNPPNEYWNDTGIMGGKVSRHLIPDGWTRLEQASYARLYSGVVLTGYDPQNGVVHPKIIEASNQEVNKLLSDRPARLLHHRFFAAILIPSSGRFYQKSAYVQTRVDEMLIACALERFRLANRQFPGTLAELAPKYLATLPKDVITGDSLKYQPAGDNQFFLYSVGWNETDDGGKPAYSGMSRDIAQGDWEWEPYTQN